MMSRPTNPFHLEAVATYGGSLHTCENLTYMSRALQELYNYLKNYPDADRRYGGAIGFRGGHGSGKTHLLAWLAQKGQELQYIQPATLYGKADSASMFDLYKQVVSQLERPRILELFNLASKNIAIELVQTAKVTESIQERIISAQDLETLYKESNLDREQIANILQTRLQETRVPTEIPRTLLAVSSPVVGEKAYRWLLGDEIPDLSTLGLAHNLRQLTEESTGSSAPDVTAVNALETIAALHRLAGVPLIILIDQLEVLLRTGISKQQTLFSVIKKLIEHLGRQQALLFIAGNDEAWRKLPRDVPPRLRLREPLQVGSLSLDETRVFIKSYLGKKLSGFSQDGVETIHELSGGNPREIIRIAYYAFEKTNGNLAAASNDILLQSAKESGTVADRCDLALSMADEVLKQYGRIAQNLAVRNDVSIDRIVKDGTVPFLALMAVKATDKLSEINLARNINTVRGYLETEWPGASLIVVAVGYSSEEVRDLLSLTSSILLFNEANFAGQLEAEVAKIAAQHETAKHSSTMPNADVLALLERISNKLEDLELGRQQELTDIHERFTKGAAKLSEPERKDRELKTRWEILAELDHLDDALRSNHTAEEREIIHTILVANEVYLRDNLVDQIGGLYLDLISIANAADAKPDVRHETIYLRTEMIGAIRRRLRRATSSLSRLTDGPGRVSLLSGILATMLVSLYYLPYMFKYGLLDERIIEKLLFIILPYGLICFAFTYLILVFSNPARNWEYRVRKLRRTAALEEPLDGESKQPTAQDE